MNKYCKGKLFDYSNLHEEECNIDLLNKILPTSSKKILDFHNSILPILTSNEKTIIDYLNNNKNVKNILSIYEKNKYKYKFDIPYIMDIIFEILEDREGNYYGRELITNKMFPIIKKENLFNLDRIHKKSYYFPKEELNNVVLTTFKKTKQFLINKIYFESPLIDQNNKIYNLMLKDGNLVANNGNKEFIVERKVGVSAIVDFKMNYHFTNIDKGNIFIDYHDDVTLKELGNYYKKYRKGINSFAFKKRINNLASKNSYIYNAKMINCDDTLLRIYNKKINKEDFTDYLRNKVLITKDNLQNGIFPLNDLILNDIDRFVEIYNFNDVNINYYISFLYTAYLLDYFKHSDNINSSYINNYINLIKRVFKSLIGNNLIDFEIDDINNCSNIEDIVNLLKNSDKVKKLV